MLLGASSGILVFLGIGEIKGAFKPVRFGLAVAALALLALGGIASTFHLGHIDRAFHILGNMGSGLSKELFAVAFTGIVTIVYAVLVRKDFLGAAKITGIIALVAGIALPLVAGASFMMPARPAWDSFTLPLMYLGTGLGMGFALSAAVTCSKGDAADAPLATRLAIVGVIFSIASVIAYVAWIALAPFAHESRSIGRLISGNLAVEFWGGVAVAGMAVPLVLSLVAANRGSKPAAGNAVDGDGAVTKKASLGQSAACLWIALVCLAVGSVALRMIMYAVATSVESLIY